MEHIEGTQMLLCDIGWTDPALERLRLASSEKDNNENAQIGEAKGNPQRQLTQPRHGHQPGDTGRTPRSQRHDGGAK